MKLTKSVAKMDKVELEDEFIDDNSIIIASKESEDDIRRSNRSTRKRASSESLLHSTKNKSIKKQKNNPVHFKTDKEAKKFYLNINKNIKVKPALLETIFEEEEEEGEDEQKKKLGKATKRTLAICDGFNITKTLINKRKNQIKRQLGSRKKPRKVALKKFMEDFKKKTAAEMTNECDLGE